eukprot:COSAG02_NODE_25130_length_668_cov_0.949033_1_plen_40_part_10
MFSVLRAALLIVAHQLASCSWGRGGLEPDGSLLRAGLSGS